MLSQSPLMDAKLRQALGMHGAGRLAEAEELYREVLGFRPGFAEVHVNCALAQLGQGKHIEAESSLQRAIAAQPNFAKAHYHLGDVLSLQNRFQAAVASYRSAVRLKSDYSEAYNNLGNVLLLLGDIAQAELAYRKAISINPNFGQCHNNLGLIYLLRGKVQDGRTAFIQAINVAPNYAEAHNNLGNALHRLHLTSDAEAAFRAAIRLAPGYADAYINLSTCLYQQQKLLEAETAATNAVRFSPKSPDAHNALGNSLREQGKLEQAKVCYLEAVRLTPHYAEAHKNLAMVLLENGRLEEAFTLFARHAELAYGSDRSQSSPPLTDPVHKQRHDMEQRERMGARETFFHIADGGRVAGSAVNPLNRVSKITEEWSSSRPQIVVIDDFLTVEALEKLRMFCLDSTIWRKAYDGGYLGAFPEHGFAPPVLAQIAEELRALYPVIIADYPLLHFWAFKYDSTLNGIKKHADFAAVNVNFWITPDDANLDPEHGGLVVWDAAAPLDWEFAKYNAADQNIKTFLEEKNSKSLTVPYRANRAAVFDSDLFHETDIIDFKTGYENRRINVTLLFGRRK